jgi:hypothetical protein
MYKNVLQTIEGVEIYPIISLLLFVAVFAIMLYKVIRADKTWVNHMAELPLEKDNPENNHIS